MNSRLETLKNAIYITNEFNRIASAIVEHVKKDSKPFIGKKIDTLKGLASKYYDAVKTDIDNIEVYPIPGTKWAKIHRASVNTSYNDLKIEISLCFSNGDNGCTYEQRSFYFGKVENSILISINDNCKVDQTILDFQTELSKIKKFRELEAQAEKAKKEILVRGDAYQYLTIGYGL